MKQLYKFGGNFSPFLVKKWPNIVYNIPVWDILIWASFVMKTSFQYVDAVKTVIVFINATSAYEQMR
jgi:uncharacterized protein (DUF983 family)